MIFLHTSRGPRPKPREAQVQVSEVQFDQGRCGDAAEGQNAEHYQLNVQRRSRVCFIKYSLGVQRVSARFFL